MGRAAAPGARGGPRSALVGLATILAVWVVIHLRHAGEYVHLDGGAEGAAQRGGLEAVAATEEARPASGAEDAEDATEASSVGGSEADVLGEATEGTAPPAASSDRFVAAAAAAASGTLHLVRSSGSHSGRDGGGGGGGEAPPSKEARRKYLGGYDGFVGMSRKSGKAGGWLEVPWQPSAHEEKVSKTGGSAKRLIKLTPDVLAALPERDALQGTRHSSCAVVGSAGLLLRRRGYGEEIDAHDAVFRFNLAPVRGFEGFVGAKTTYRLVNRKHLGFRETANETVLQHATTADVIRQYVEMQRLLAPTGLKSYALDMGFYEHALAELAREAKGSRPTNGFFGLHLGLMLCERVDIYGFLRNWKGWTKYHYFNDEEPNSDQIARDTGGEMPLIEKLLKSSKGRLRFAHPCIVSSRCEGCPEGAACGKDAPFPVPQPGWCVRKREECFTRCQDPSECKGGAKGFCRGVDLEAPCERLRSEVAAE